MQAEFLGLWRAGGNHQEMVEDWQAVIGAPGALLELQRDAYHWVGVSMDTAYGLPLLGVEKRIGAAVNGMWACPIRNRKRWRRQRRG